MNGYLLNTHTWLWMQQGRTDKLSRGTIREIEAAQARNAACVSDVSVLEIARLVAYGQFDLGISVEQFIAEATVDGGLRLMPLTTRILIASTRLPGEIHRDPSDRLLVATALEHGLTLVTRDKQLLDYAEQGHLKASKP